MGEIDASNEADASGDGSRGAAWLERLTADLEAIVADRDLIAPLSVEERARLLTAAGAVYEPDITVRRQRAKAKLREDRAARVRREQEQLDRTAIRALRAKPVYTTPNVYPSHRIAALAALAASDGAAAADSAVAPDWPATFEGSVEADFRPAAEPIEVLTGLDSGAELHCYVCKRKYTLIHRFYDQMCPECGDVNEFKRTETADLRGTVALLTGGRVKIGYQAGIKLLRAGCSLIVTTRFPRDSAARYAAEPDFDEWSDRLEIFGLDLRHTPSVEAFCSHLLATRTRLDFIVNNACQTVRRPPEFYRHMMEGEQAALAQLPAASRRLLGEYEGLRSPELLPTGPGALTAAPGTPGDPEVLVAGEPGRAAERARSGGIVDAAALSQIVLTEEDAAEASHLFPSGRLDQDLQQVDLRGRNSWRLTLAEVSSVELLETQLVNAVAPFVLNARLKPLMVRTPGRAKHIVNVSAVEGQFYRNQKTIRHPHTNMAKAALNMMTRTSAADYHADGIHMNSVDTGWVSDEDPTELAERKRAEHRFHPPLDIVDGAARIVDPIIDGYNTGTHRWGLFLKDYQPTDW